MARRATDNLSVILWGLYNWHVRGRPFNSEGGGLSNFVWTDNLFSGLAQPENLFSCGMDSGKLIFI